MAKPINTLDELFESVLLKEDDIQSIIAEECYEDELFGYLEENRKVSIFDSEFILEGEE